MDMTLRNPSFWFCPLLFIAWLASPTYAALPPPSAHWSFEEVGYTASTEVADNRGQHPGTAMGGAMTGSLNPAFPALGGDSDSGRYLVLDGNNDYVRVPFAVETNPAEFTVSAWVRANNTRDWASVITSRVGGSSGPHGYNLYDADGSPGKWEAWVGSVQPERFHRLKGPRVRRDGWQHVAMRFAIVAGRDTDSPTGDFTLFVDGEPRRTGSASLSPLTIEHGNPLTIGAGGAIGEKHRLKGAIDEVMVFDEPLDNEAIRYLGRVAGTYAVTPLQAHLSLSPGMAFTQDLPARAFVDLTGGTMSYSAVNLPPGIDLDPGTGRLYGTPTAAGEYEVTITATSTNGHSATQSQRIEVDQVNHPPEIVKALASRQALEDEPLSISIPTSGFFDRDRGDSLGFSIVDKPDWMQVEGLDLAGTPDNDDVGQHTITVRATDSGGASTDLDIGVTVFLCQRPANAHRLRTQPTDDHRQRLRDSAVRSAI